MSTLTPYTWTPSDESTLRTLLEFRRKTMVDERAFLLDLVAKRYVGIAKGPNDARVERLANHLIQNATEFRRLLAPFDLEAQALTKTEG